MLCAQELNCTIQLNSELAEKDNNTVSKSVYDKLKQVISDYVNNIRWTNLTYAEQERIECSMMLIVKKVDGDKFNCELQVQARRPVFASSYTTTTLNFRDTRVNFTYQDGDRLEYQENVFNTNLTAVLAYYCYLIIGHDMDSFSRLGGTPCFQQCENIVTAAQSSSMDASEMSGWEAFGVGSNKNRYTLVNNLRDEAFKKYREFYYTYHRLCLDDMNKNADNARARIADEISVLRDANRARPTTYLINAFLDAKADELVDIFRRGTDTEKKNVYQILMDIDPTRQSTYDRINE